MFLKSVLIGFLSFSILHAETLKECKSDEDKISGCVERKYYVNGNLSFETPYKDNKREGIEKWYFENGNLWRETPYKNGKEEGIEKWYYWNGSLRTETPYKNDKAEGIAKEYYSDGNLAIETPYKNDKREGIEKWYYWNGNLMAEIPYLNYYFHGDMKYYTEDKKLLALVKAENGKIISGKCFDDKVLTDKEREDLRRLKSVEEAIVYLQKICLKESDSNSTLYADTLKECKSDEDKISGCVEKKYDLNGKLIKETPYKNGEFEGMEKEYYENGNLHIETPYKNGKIEGIEKWYYENGNLASEIPHKNDEAHGNLKYYTEDGELLALLKAENGKITSGKCYNNKAPTNKDLEEIGRFYSAGKGINYLQKICLKESDSK